MDMVKPAASKLPGWTSVSGIQTAPPSNPANSEILNSTANGVQERSNGPRALHFIGAGVHRMRVGCGIVSEANALGKAEGYADGDTVTWKIEVQVGV
jgi:hypothetical protein